MIIVVANTPKACPAIFVPSLSRHTNDAQQRRFRVIPNTDLKIRFNNIASPGTSLPTKWPASIENAVVVIEDHTNTIPLVAQGPPRRGVLFAPGAERRQRQALCNFDAHIFVNAVAVDFNYLNFHSANVFAPKRARHSQERLQTVAVL